MQTHAGLKYRLKFLALHVLNPRAKCLSERRFETHLANKSGRTSKAELNIGRGH